MKKYLAMFLFGLCLAIGVWTCVRANTSLAQEKTITLTDAQVRACELGGGCVTLSRMALQHALRQAVQAGATDGLEQGARLGFEAGQADCRAAREKKSI